MNTPRALELRPLYRPREQGRQETVREVEQMRRRYEAPARRTAYPTEFERMEAERPIVEESFRSGSLLPLLEVRKQEAESRVQARIEQLKERYTHAKLQADLKKAFGQVKARQHARQIQAAIMAHPEVLQLLHRGGPIRTERNRVIIGPQVLEALLKAAQLRRQFHDALVRDGTARMAPRRSENPWKALRKPGTRAA